MKVKKFQEVFINRQLFINFTHFRSIYCPIYNDCVMWSDVYSIEQTLTFSAKNVVTVNVLYCDFLMKRLIHPASKSFYATFKL